MGEPAANSAVAEVVATSGTTTPISFNGDGHLYAANLFLSLAFAVFGVAVFGRHMWALVTSIGHRRDKWLEPVSVSRVMWMCAGLALAMRAGVEAAELLAWSPHDPVNLCPRHVCQTLDLAGLNNLHGRVDGARRADMVGAREAAAKGTP
jgi:hypothetical protein